MVASRIDRRARVLSWLLTVALAVFADGARAQAPDRAIEFEDLGLTRTGDLSARGAGLAGFAPVTADLTALVYNPAGLCRIKQRTALLSLSYDERETVTSYGGQPVGISSDRQGLLFAGAAIPFPTHRGSLVTAIGVHRMFLSDLNLAYESVNTIDRRNDAFRLEQSGSTYALDLGFGVDLASVLSAGMSLSLFEGGYHALRQSRTYEESTTLERYVIDDIEGDLDGAVGRIGLILFAHRHAHIAINVTTQTLVNGATSEASEITEVVENDVGSTVNTTSESTTEYILPYRLDGGIEVPWGDWLLALQAGTCDWSNAAIDKNGLRLPDGNAVMGRTVDLRAGVEWTSPWWPLRLRAGVAQLPFAPDYVQADRVDNDQLEEVIAESPPRQFSFGAGIAFKRTILIDAAYTHTTGDRSGSSFTEERTSSQFVIEGSYWF